MLEGDKRLSVRQRKRKLAVVMAKSSEKPPQRTPTESRTKFKTVKSKAKKKGSTK